MEKVVAFWFRRDLRLEDNRGLHRAIESGYKVLPVFFFDPDILDDLPRNDARVTFIHQRLNALQAELQSLGSSLYVRYERPEVGWKHLSEQFDLQGVFFNRDYEPYARKRDQQIEGWLNESGIAVHSFKDQVIFETDEVLKPDGKPYTVFTPYKRQWMARFTEKDKQPYPKPDQGFVSWNGELPSLEEMGFESSSIRVPDYDLSQLDRYGEVRNFPGLDATSQIGPHLRFGTIGIRKLIAGLGSQHEVYLNELIWREFFMQILYHFPENVHRNFKSQYDGVPWRNHAEDFELWCQGKTGYPLVDAGMRELLETGRMSNRVRMVVAGFLCKHLLIHWSWGEAFFAKHLLDFELSANNGNWQWAAGTGCDAAPYFRIFNPMTQQEKFDAQGSYVKRWVPEWGTDQYPKPMVEHTFARNRALEAFQKATRLDPA
ncbi:deoxyribodipyrimidine photo-lyase [bacterium SCSIO 12741]|nr:deoxyribodipyrimidine photo-lyase [bacterium SCSIO 12741]